MSNAAVLAFGVPGARPENSVIYQSNDWTELAMLLTNPSHYLGAKAIGNSSVGWDLLAPATVVIEPLGDTDSLAIRDAYLLGWGGPDGFELSFSDIANQARQFLNRTGFLNAGYFIAEFATFTSILSIRYRRPDKPDPTEKFTGNILPVTHVPIAGFGVGNIHFDIESKLGVTPIHRANLIVDYIEDGKRLADRLNSATTPIDWYEGSATLVPIPTNPPITPMPVMKLTTHDMVQPENSSPRIVMEGASVPGLPKGFTVCIDGDTRIADKIIYIGDLVIKLYS